MDERADLGELDDDLVVPDREQLKSVGTITCRRCGFPGLHWQEHEDSWRLFDNRRILHECMKTFRPIEEEVTNFLINRLECRKMVLNREQLVKFYNLYPYGLDSNDNIVQAIKQCDATIAKSTSGGDDGYRFDWQAGSSDQ